MQKKVIGYSRMSKIMNTYTTKKKVLAGGCFDIFHYGHFLYLTHAKQIGDILIVALESDEFIRERKRREPIHSQENRAKILASLEIVDVVVCLPYLKSYREYLKFTKRIAPDIIAITEGDPMFFEKQKQAHAIGARVEMVCSLVMTPSTTNIIQYASLFSN